MAALRSITASSLSIPFKLAFKHASAARAATQALWVTAEGHDGVRGFGEGCPREYVTSESIASAQAFVAGHSAAWLAQIRDAGTLDRWVRDHEREIDANPAAWAAVELAVLDLIGKSERKPVEALLRLPPLSGKFRYTAVIGDGPPQAFDAQLAKYRQAGFRDFKIKLSGDAARDASKARSLEAAGIAPDAVRADANNLWSAPEDAFAYLRGLRFPFHALEEPLRAGAYAGMARLASRLGTKIIVDESMARREQLALLRDAPASWIVNLRVSKMGGLMRSLEFLRDARGRKLRVIVGAHVGETSLLTRAALVIASAAGDSLVAQEGAFGTHLLERDVVEPPLMFGPAGILDADRGAMGRAPGWGLQIREGAAGT
jgi:L-alanine-DL-glutamate epimerase-like enolase superfamily enzyme